MTEQEQGFTVKDRRSFNEDGSTREEAPEPQAAPQTAQADEGGHPAEPEGAAQGQRPPIHDLPPVEFSGLIISLAHAAMMHLGHIPDPATGQPRPEPALARHTIDTIGMLKDKTQGNLTQDEQRLIEGTLTELRLAYVQSVR